MKRFILGFIAFGFIIGGVTFNSCNSKKATTCNWEISSTELITFNLMDKTIGYEVDIRTKKIEGMFIECASQKAKENEKIFQYFKNYCTNKGFILNNKTMAFVIYYDGHISQSLSITDEHIKGISAYIVEGDEIMHHLYLRDKQFNFFEVENVNVAVPAVTTNHIFFYLENYVFTDVQNVSTISIGGDFAVETYKNIEKYRRTPIRFEVSVRFKAGPTNLTQAGNGANCCNCGGCVPGYCQFPLWDPPYCIFAADDGKPGCSRQAAYYGGEQFAYAYDPYLTYAFINDFLPHSDKGRKYIDYYYWWCCKKYAGLIDCNIISYTQINIYLTIRIITSFFKIYG